MNNISAKPQTKSRSMTRLPFDVPLVLIIAALLVIGLLMVYSSSWDASLIMEKPPTYIFTRQVLWVALGIAVAVGLSYFDYHKFEPFVAWLMLGVIAMLTAVVIRNSFQGISSRSLLNNSVQPAEFAKLGIVLYLSFWLSKRKDLLHDKDTVFIPLVFILGLVAGLIVIQPDLSAAITVGALVIMLFFLSGADLKQTLILFLLVAIVGGGVIAISSTGQARINDYLQGLQDPINSSYHVQRTYEAIIKGGFFGVGIGQADTKFTGLPLPHTDSIFAVIAEETGLVGSFVVIILYVLLMWRGVTIAKRAPDQAGSLLAFGLISWIVIEALMNFAVIVGLMPFTGNALPLISAGGSSMLTTMAAIGITMNVARQGTAKEIAERSQTSAVVNLRGRDGWRRVSGTNRFGDS